MNLRTRIEKIAEEFGACPDQLSDELILIARQTALGAKPPTLETRVDWFAHMRMDSFLSGLEEMIDDNRSAEPPDHVAPQAIVEGRRNEDWSMEVVGQYPLSGDAKCDIYRCVIDVPVFNGSVRFEGSYEDITALEALLERVEITKTSFGSKKLFGVTGIRHKL